jgi:glucose-6-phosphate isomerase
VQSVIWGINPYDQWGVELGKGMAVRIGAALDAGRVDELPGVAATLLDLARD